MELTSSQQVTLPDVSLSALQRATSLSAFLPVLRLSRFLAPNVDSCLPESVADKRPENYPLCLQLYHAEAQLSWLLFCLAAKSTTR